MRKRGRGRGGAHDGAGEEGRAAQSGQPAPLVTATRRSKQRHTNDEAPPPRKRSRAARHPVVIVLNFALFALVMAIFGTVAAFVIGRQAYLAAGPLEMPVQLNIPRGASVQSIAQGLEAEGVISNQYVFIAAAYGTGSTQSVKAGEYAIEPEASMADVLAKIVSGDVVQHQITIAEGLSSAQVVNRLNENQVLTGTISEIPPEGSLLPETYRVTRGMSRARVLELMRNAREQVLAQAWENRDPDLPIESPSDLVTLASIVEKETGQREERGRVASVFVNRLRQGMKLQSDPTILYGLYGGEAWNEGRTIYQSDLDRANPYNTYQIDGLPPGPIANPGREALMATANPDETTDLFFVADGTGGHAFARTYAEHQENVARWREIERARNSSSETQ
ncbi:MAG: endolytic transglycosylase MltG [Pseudomonadota bacterium]